MKQPKTSSKEHGDLSRAAKVQHPKRGAIPTPLSDIEKAPVFAPVFAPVSAPDSAPNQGPEDQEQTSLASGEIDGSHRKG